MRRYIFTCGDINGIGPEICLKTLEKLQSRRNEQYIFICPGNIFSELYKSLKLTFKYELIKSIEKISDTSEKVSVISMPDVRQKYGKPSAKSGKVSYHALVTAKKLLNNHSALITAPISKEALKMAGINFPGHTEMIAEWYNIDNYCMMFLSNKFKCGLVTIHESIRNVPKLITNKKIKAILQTIYLAMRVDFGIAEPTLAVLGLNPHAGESGKIGLEEEQIIFPVLEEFKPCRIDGPMVPDAFFANQLHLKYDCTIGMYHDQVLIPFKLLNFESGVNFTAGLPVVRTSPDHGTAFDIAGTNSANPHSMIEAYKWAKKILKKRCPKT